MTKKYCCKGVFHSEDVCYPGLYHLLLLLLLLEQQLLLCSLEVGEKARGLSTENGENQLGQAQQGGGSDR